MTIDPIAVENQNIFKVFQRIVPFLPKGTILKLGFIFAATLVTALTEVCFAGIMALFAASIVNPDEVLLSSYLTTSLKYLSISKETVTASTLLITLAGASMFAVLFKNLTRGALITFQDRIATRLSAHVGQLMLQIMLARPYRWFIKRNSSDILTSISWARNTATFTQGVLMALCEIIIVTLMLGAMLLVDPLGVLIVLIFLTLISLLIYVNIKKRTDETARQLTIVSRTANRNATKAIHGFKDVKVFGCQDFFIRKYRQELDKIPPLSARLKFLNFAPSLVLETLGISLLCMITIYMMFIQEGSSAKVTGSLIFMGVTVWRGLPSFVRALSQFTAIRTTLPMVFHTLHHLEEFAEDISTDSCSSDALPLPMHDSISFKNVTYAYEEHRTPALSDVSFTLNYGEALGIIGKSGAGKSTLVDILIGLMPPSQGVLALDGTPLADDLTERWLHNVGYVSQEPYIYDGTLLQNIAFGSDEAHISREWVLECCRMASVTDFLDDLPKGLDTQLGERGTRLSGGQRQRVVIARALFKRPNIVVFDEATSALDSKSEREIQQTMYDLKGSVTIVIVAHRLTTVENCDRLLWLDKGRMRLEGPPNQVLPRYNAALDQTVTHEPSNRS